MKSFDELCKEGKIGKAVILYFPSLNSRMIENIKFREWIEVREKAPVGSKVRLFAEKQLKKLKVNLSELPVDNIERADEFILTLALDKISMAEGSPDEWHKILCKSSYREAIYDVALEKIINHKSKPDFKWWEKITKKKSFTDRDEKLKLDKMAESASNFSEWASLYNSLIYMSCISYKRKKVIEERSIKGMHDTAKTMGNWRVVYSVSGLNSEICKIAARQIFARTKIFDDWVYILEHNRIKEYEKEAIEKIAELTIGFEQYISVLNKFYYSCGSYSKLRSKIIKKEIKQM